ESVSTSSISPTSSTSLSIPTFSTTLLFSNHLVETSFEDVSSSVESDSNLEEIQNITNYHTKKFKNKRKPAPICDYLDTLEDGSRNCKLCNNKWGSSTSLSTITRHFENKHPRIFKDLRQATTKFAHPPYSMVERIEKSRVESLNKDLWEWIVTSQLPFSIVEETRFIKLFTNLDPRYKTPCRQTLSTT
ncbi:6065_t:CDS:1, partial [Acaulospora morrowiae]